MLPLPRKAMLESPTLVSSGEDIGDQALQSENENNSESEKKKESAHETEMKTKSKAKMRTSIKRRRK